MPGRLGRKSIYGEFQLAGEPYKLCITDPAIRHHFETLPRGTYPFPSTGSIFLSVSLTEPYEGDGRCHKLIAAVIAEHTLARS